MTEKDFSRPLGDCIRKARLSAGLTQDQLAEQIETTQRTILNIENYQSNPQMTTLYPLIRALNIDPRSIFYPEQPEYGSQPRIEMLFSTCTDAEIEAIIPIGKAAIQALRSGPVTHLK